MARSSSKHPSAPASFEHLSGSVEDTQLFGQQLGRRLQPGDVVALYGQLGSGKTTLIQGIAQGLGRDPHTIKSPTFVLMREYAPGPTITNAGEGGEIPLVHIDGYRLEGSASVAWLDLDLIFSPHKITLIEWAERFDGLLPPQYLEVQLEHLSTNRRKIIAIPHGPQLIERLGQLGRSAATTQEVTGDVSRD